MYLASISTALSNMLWRQILPLFKRSVLILSKGGINTNANKDK